ncbi:MAG TPA: Asp/Glu racemase [Nocardioidaceae bacterium]|nr:Asp/Glu racemase [Nocardioidaceae bacterium]
MAAESVPGPRELSGLGIVVPSDFALDKELWRWAPDGISLHVNRMGFVPVPVTLAMAHAVSDQVLVGQAAVELSTVASRMCAYMCASGSFVDGLAGEKLLREQLMFAGFDAAVTTSGALLQALEHLQVRTLAVATPYIDGLAWRLLDFLGEAGVDTVGGAHLGLTGAIWKVSYDEVVRLVRAADHPDAEAIFVSCTNVPTYDVIAPLEAELGKPVLTANQVTMWAASRGLGDRAIGYGQRLLDDALRWQPDVAV